MKNRLIITSVLLISTICLFSQNISNISVSQRQDGSGKVDVNYTLSGNENAYNISAEVSLDNGNTWQSITNLSGHVYNVSPGNRQLVWNAGTEMPGEYVSNARIKLTATEAGGGTGQPCPGIPTVNYEGQTYNTVLIGNQCWLKENLNVGTMINGTSNQTNNGTIEKYCYNNDPSKCVTYGGLYQWNEMMQYVTTPGTQGICPSGWHIPTDDEWKILEGTVDSQYGVGDPVWNGTLFRGFDAGYHLKSTTGWYINGNGDDSFGFTALPGGRRDDGGSFDSWGFFANFWSSTVYSGSSAWRRFLCYYTDKVYRHHDNKTIGFSARCLQDY